VARKAVNDAREQVAALVGVQPAQVVFVSGGTEANNLFIRGAAAHLKPSQVAVSAIEHPCVAKPAQDLGRQGWRCASSRSTKDGRVDLARRRCGARRGDRPGVGDAREQRDRRDPGRRGEVAAKARARARGCIPMRCRRWARFRSISKRSGVHAMTLSAHKLYGPKGAGALVVDKRLELKPIIRAAATSAVALRHRERSGDRRLRRRLRARGQPVRRARPQARSGCASGSTTVCSGWAR
jgi:cysteine desulfurase